MLRPLKRWQATSIGSIPMGHELSVTSLQLAQLGSVIANGGFLVHPHLIAWEQSAGGPKEKVEHPSSVQVLKPENVMTVRRMMQRVVMPGGTAPQLHVAGYTIAGKTGTAQIYDFDHRVYTHKYNASFLGFAPMRNPRVVIIVTVSGTTGQAGFGGFASGPAFVNVMSTALRRVGVARDVPEEIEELAAKEKAKVRNNSKEQDKDSDDVSIAALDPPTQDELRASLGEAAVDGTAPSDDADPNAPKVPNFVGRTIRDVMQLAASESIEVDMFGDGLAREQNPPAGALLVEGEHIRVRFRQ
jgi:cell division protein FtsI (penicillin-binding protein 3)